jgi:hypothetical protein
MSDLSPLCKAKWTLAYPDNCPSHRAITIRLGFGYLSAGGRGWINSAKPLAHRAARWMTFASRRTCAAVTESCATSSLPSATNFADACQVTEICRAVCRLSITRQLPLSPMMILTRWIEHSFDAAVQRAYDADARKHGGSAAVGDEHERLDRGLPFGQHGFFFGSPVM